jgi:hypothetical protein
MHYLHLLGFIAAAIFAVFDLIKGGIFKNPLVNKVFRVGIYIVFIVAMIGYAINEIQVHHLF